MSLTLLIVVVLTVAVTFVIVVTSVILVINKNAAARRQRLRLRLGEHYAELVTAALASDLPALPADAPPSARFKQYSTLIVSMKQSMRQLSARRRRHHRDALLAVLLEFAQDLTGETAERLVYMAYAFEFVEELSNKLANRHWWVRAQAAQDLGRLRARRAIAPLTAALEDPHPDVRFQAIEALTRLVGVDALRTVFRISKNLTVWHMMDLSVTVLRFREDAVPYLVEGLQSRDPSVIVFCIEMLAEIGFVSAVDPLMAMASDYPNISVRAKALEALGRLGDSRAEELLMRNASNPIPELRMKALGALRRVGTPAAIPLLSSILGTGDHREKLASARALASAGTAGVDRLRREEAAGGGLTASVAAQVLEEVERGGSD